MQHWIELFITQIKETGPLQWIATIFGMAEVLLAKRNNILLYPAGIIGIVLSLYLLVDVRLYAEAALNMYYLVMSIYGWVYWMKKRDEPPVEISYANRNEWYVTLAISLGGWAVLYLLLKYFTPSDVPILDSFVSSTAWAGMWLLARRKIENWVLLNISNFVAVPLLFYKGLPLFACLTIFLFVVAIFGYFDWKKKLDGKLNVAAH
ncbi:nicotinamide riboside transporter PnuC [Mucilaginibacter sp. UR6-1]|uniref:nicotinamide riboside transporter PnuC n=1 Tax=Mucilaginibacter sp. UR6-1 TaxID=1435643 RepID=UPI001E533043|nr:nicotinamide riboside transporter PnuC [Mucilaginibacter sp. UR6-1]MCC8410454.1 nicotinamide riboside transporter PnuC [Mucilaginibacter sp. UR6-1]